MKRLVIIQLKGNSFGGIWQVNKQIAMKLLEEGMDVRVISMRDNPGPFVDEYDPRLHVHAVNPNELWEFTRKQDVKDTLMKGNLLKTCFLLKKVVHEKIVLNRDYHALKRELRALNPDYILVSHYQIIKGIPKEFYSRTIFHQHCSFTVTKNHKPTITTLMKYRNQFKFLWLSKAIMKEAKEYGFQNSTYIYNPVRFTVKEKADVVENKKLVTIARISEEKRIPFMAEIVSEVFGKEKFKDWTFEVYGNGDNQELEKMKKQMKYPERMHYMGLTNHPKDVLLTSSLHLNTSKYEGFSLSILEANECGVPTITFPFGEAVYEEIKDNKTGMIVSENTKEKYISILEEIMSDSNKLEELSCNVKKFSKQFHIDEIIKDWHKLFEQIDGDDYEKN